MTREDGATSGGARDEIVKGVAGCSPWTGDFEGDWCYFCGAEPDYDSNPWTGHEESCLWVRARALVSDLAHAKRAS